MPLEADKKQTDKHTYAYNTDKQFQETIYTPAKDWHTPGLKTQQNDFLKSDTYVCSYG